MLYPLNQLNVFVPLTLTVTTDSNQLLGPATGVESMGYLLSSIYNSIKVVWGLPAAWG